MNIVEAFINNFKEFFVDEFECKFYYGYCYWFAFILAQRFNGEIWFNPDIVHFATYIKSDYGNEEGLYDIFGLINIGKDPITGGNTSDKWLSWTEFQLNYQDSVEKIIETCINKV